MDPKTIRAINRAAARQADEARDVFMAGVAAGIAITVDAVEDGRANPEWCALVRDMVALHREHSRV